MSWRARARHALLLASAHVQHSHTFLCLPTHKRCTASAARVRCRDFGSRVEALKILQELLSCMGKAASSQLPTIMSSAWRLFEAAPAVYEALVIPNISNTEDGHDTTAGSAEGGGSAAGGSKDGGSGRESGGESTSFAREGDVTFEAVVEQLYEFLLTVQGSAALQPQLKGALRQVVHNTICFMQVRHQSLFDCSPFCPGGCPGFCSGFCSALSSVVVPR